MVSVFWCRCKICFDMDFLELFVRLMVSEGTVKLCLNFIQQAYVMNLLLGSHSTVVYAQLNILLFISG